MKVALVIVTYNAPDALKKHLEVLRSQSRKPDRVIIVNNGKDVSWLLDEFRADFAVDAMNFDNIGPAGGFMEGQKKAYADGYDIIILADDDAWPAARDTIARLAGGVEDGTAPVMGAWDSDGNAASCSNHYHAIHRSVFAKAGFYFGPFFMMGEDIEFPGRIRRVAEIRFDGDAPIYHPHTPAFSPLRAYLSYRNRQAAGMASGDIAGCVASFCYYLYRSLFIWIYLGKGAYLSSFIRANLDLLRGRLGKADISAERLRGTGAARVHDEGRAVFVAIGAGSLHPPSPGIREVKEPRGAFGAMLDFAGKDLVIAFPMSMGYPPPALLARNVYWYDARTKEMEFVYRNNPVLSLLSLLAAAPPLALLAPLAAAAFLLGAGRYKRIMDKHVEEGIAFCREADRKLARAGRGGKNG